MSTLLMLSMLNSLQSHRYTNKMGLCLAGSQAWVLAPRVCIVTASHITRRLQTQHKYTEEQ